MSLSAHNLDGLNPCFCGRWSLSYPFPQVDPIMQSLNPCFCGRWSLSSVFLFIWLVCPLS